MTNVNNAHHVLRANAITNLPDRRLAVVHLLPNDDDTGPGGARLFVATDDEGQDLDVAVGGTFPVGAETWRLDEVHMPEDRRFWAAISRVR